MAERSVWTYVGIGCGILALAGTAVFVIGGLWVYRGAKRLGEELKDPVARTARVQRVLGADRLPDGYHAMLAVSVPLLMDVAILSDRPPDEKGEVNGFDERGLIYFQLIRMGQDQQELKDYFEGRTEDPRVLRENGINLDVEEILDRGIFSSDEAEMMYVAQRGSVSTQGYSGRGITSLVLIDCPEDKRARMAVWFGPDPAPETPAAELDLTGTTGDRQQIAPFLEHFRFCR